MKKYLENTRLIKWIGWFNLPFGVLNSLYGALILYLGWNGFFTAFGALTYLQAWAGWLLISLATFQMPNITIPMIEEIADRTKEEKKLIEFTKHAIKFIAFTNTLIMLGLLWLFS